MRVQVRPSLQKGLLSTLSQSVVHVYYLRLRAKQQRLSQIRQDAAPTQSIKQFILSKT